MLSRARRATLDAAARRIVPHAYTDAGGRVDVAAEVEARLARAHPRVARDVGRALDLLGSRGAALLTVGRATPFRALPPALQDAMLARWGSARVPLLRTIHQAVRRLTLATYYALPVAQRGIGYPGPLHEREPGLAWEGALPGTPRDDEPVARLAGDGRGAIVDEARDDAVLRARHPLPRGVVHGRDLAGEQRTSADVVVIGSGAGGAVAAARLAAAGLDVVILEEGGWWDAPDFTEREGEMAERLYADGALRATDDLSLALLQGRCAGGGTTINWMVTMRTPEWVLDEWARRHGTVGMSAAELAPVFGRIEREVHARRVPDDAHSPNNRLILDGARALGWRAWSGAINARGCVRSGFCGQGCRYDAKQGTLVTYLPRALGEGARLFADVRADRIELTGRGARDARRATKRVHASVLDRDTGAVRATLVVEAPAVVVAGGAVGTTLLLERSGLGGGGVGRFLRLHPTTAVLGLYDRPIVASAGIPLSAVCDEFLRRDENGYGFWIECPPLHPALSAVAASGFGAEHREVMERSMQLGAMIALVRDGAERDRSSGSVHAARDGTARIRYRLTPRDRAHLVEAIEAAARLHLAAGAPEVRTLHTRACRIRSERDVGEIRARPHGPNDLALFSAHVNGTCRIGTDPRTSGCTPDGERHGAPGVFVCDGSLLPTALGVNPQETIMALATVVAERIAARAW